MRHACCVETSPHYTNAGAIGITMDPNWIEMKTGFDNFVRDVKRYLGHKPFEDAILNRQDTSGDFMISNLRWTSRKGMSNNRKGNMLITYKKKTRTLAEWAPIIGISYDCLYSRLHDYGMTPEKAFTHEWYSRTNKKTV